MTDSDSLHRPILTLRGLDKSYRDERVLSNLDLDVNEGEYLVVLGPSGCGKSTLLQLIAGLLTLDAGEITLGSRSLSSTAPQDRDISILFQDDRLYPHWTLRQNLEIAIRRSQVKSLARDALVGLTSRFGIADLLDRRPDQISGGQLRRAALAKALLRQPAICLLDEPLTAIDSMLREDVMEILTNHPRARGEGLSPTAFVHVTHDGDEAMRLADRIVVMGAGQVIQSDAPERLYHQPHSLEAARAIGTPSANLIPMRWLCGVSPESAAVLKQTLPGCHDSATLVIRPETIHINPSDAKQFGNFSIDETACSFTGLVVSSRFVTGRWFTRLVVEPSGAERLFLNVLTSPRINNRSVRAEVALSDLVCLH